MRKCCLLSPGIVDSVVLKKRGSVIFSECVDVVWISINICYFFFSRKKKGRRYTGNARFFLFLIVDIVKNSKILKKQHFFTKITNGEIIVIVNVSMYSIAEPAI